MRLGPQVIQKLYQEDMLKLKSTKKISTEGPVTRVSQGNPSALPENPFKDISDCERRLRKHHNKNHVCPCVLTKLILVHLFLECQNKPHETYQRNSVVTCKTSILHELRRWQDKLNSDICERTNTK